MTEYQSVSPSHPSAFDRPHCPKCKQNRMLLSQFEAGPPGFVCRTFECQKCGRVETVVASNDPMKSSARGWLAGELKPPT